MRLTSTAFADGSAIPRRFTCDGEDVSPPLNWSDAPTDTRSFALLCDDPDAPAGTWHHWAAYDIPSGLTTLVQRLWERYPIRARRETAVGRALLKA
jgi:Raf kinase inhibitor-like YbhB/YbcL family protein